MRSKEKQKSTDESDSPGSRIKDNACVCVYIDMLGSKRRRVGGKEKNGKKLIIQEAARASNPFSFSHLFLYMEMCVCMCVYFGSS